MAIVFTAYEPQQVERGTDRSPDIQFFPITAGQTFTRGQLVTLTSGALVVNAQNDAATLGLALADASAVFTNVAGQPVASQPFGTGQNLGTALFPGDQTMCPVLLFHGNQYLEMSLLNALAGTAPAFTNVGATFGLKVTSGVHIADTTQANKIGTIVAVTGGPLYNAAGTASENAYQAGDTFARVIVEFTPSVLVL